MSSIKPCIAVGYHFFNDFDTRPNVEARVRTTYDGPLAMATGYMVFNITKDDIRVRTHSHGSEGDHAHEALAFTTWIDFSLAAEHARAIAAALNRKRPDGA